MPSRSHFPELVQSFECAVIVGVGFERLTPPPPSPLIVKQISGKIWHNRGFNDNSVKTSKNVDLDLLKKIRYGPIA